MSEVQDIRSAIRHLNHWQQGAFALACAEHVAPAFCRLASITTVPVYNEALVAAWRIMAAGTPASLEGQQALDLPESEVNDPYRQDYFAMRALDVLRVALEAMMQVPKLDSVDLACCGAIDIYSDFDGFEADWPRATIDPRDSPPPPGRLESFEIRAQQATLEILRLNAPTREICNRLREHAQVASQQLDAVMPKFLQQGSTRDKD